MKFSAGMVMIVAFALLSTSCQAASINFKRQPSEVPYVNELSDLPLEDDDLRATEMSLLSESGVGAVAESHHSNVDAAQATTSATAAKAGASAAASSKATSVANANAGASAAASSKAATAADAKAGASAAASIKAATAADAKAGASAATSSTENSVAMAETNAAVDLSAASVDDAEGSMMSQDEIDNDLVNALQDSDDHINAYPSLVDMTLQDERAKLEQQHDEDSMLEAESEAAAAQEGAMAGEEEAPPVRHSLLAVHPTIGQALGSMKDQMGQLKNHADELKAAQGRLQGLSDSTEQILSQGTKLRRQVISREAELRVEDVRLRALRGESKRIQVNHNALLNKLHAVLDPRLLAAQERSEESRKSVNSTQDEADLWTKRRDETKQGALDRIVQRRQRQQGVETAEQAAIKAEQARDKALRLFALAKREAAEALESYKYADAHYQAAMSKEEEIKEESDKEAVSFQRLKRIADVEVARIERSAEQEKKQLAFRVAALERAHNNTAMALGMARSQYGAWQASATKQRQAKELQKANYDAHVAKYNNEIRNVYKAAEAKAGHLVNQNAHLNPSDWAWGEGMD